MHRIVIDVDHVSDAEANEAVRAIREKIFDANTTVWAVRVESRDLKAAEIAASEKVWRAAFHGSEGVVLSQRETEALWQRVLNESREVRAFRRP